MSTKSVVPRDSLQAKKHEVVRREIWDAAIRLFHAHGFNEVTIDQIAELAGVSRRTYFRYFSSKEDVMGSMVKNYGAGLTQAILAEESGLSSFEAAKAAITKVLVPTLSVTERILQIAHRSPAARMAQFLEVPMLEEELAKAFATRVKRKGLPSLEDRILASITLSMTGLCVEMWVAQQNRPMNKIVDEVFHAVRRACSPEDGKRR
ncbi:transcriptional regulator, TetR family [Granulicella pectinivorans]|jgi:AcrR family transcriptional regulator|uniref:Transcriptional regulator, TetR family n=1 Tax=Granulicella pectinivorans TaxID=474950 RepID=A0A1I6L4R6_9BACT|nr:TetR family transcriptional regulator [Granulicella pectinivorans]SFR98459.1 transcriptional regulator, TetR family [Granulicella pectinivorans]